VKLLEGAGSLLGSSSVQRGNFSTPMTAVESCNCDWLEFDGGRCAVATIRGVPAVVGKLVHEVGSVGWSRREKCIPFVSHREGLNGVPAKDKGSLGGLSPK